MAEVRADGTSDPGVDRAAGVLALNRDGRHVLDRGCGVALSGARSSSPSPFCAGCAALSRHTYALPGSRAAPIRALAANPRLNVLGSDLAGQERPEPRSRPQQERDVNELKSRQLAQLQSWFQMQIAGGRRPLSTSLQDMETFEDMERRFIRTYRR
jgi:hypothetical protein